MTLRRRLTLQIAATLFGVALLGVAGVVGVRSLRADVDVSLRANDQLRHVFTAGARVAAARAAVDHASITGIEAAAEVERAAGLLATFDDGWVDDTVPEARAAVVALRDAAVRLRVDASIDAFAEPYARLADLVAATRRTIVRRQQIADEKQRWTAVSLATLALAVTAGTVVLGVSQYRAVMRPLRDVRGAARRIASGAFTTRAPGRGDAEFAALAGDFNRMAADLEALYGDLRAKIDEKGRELAQSERLASVGHLAAGVAHEINNPLGIIAGHGERALMHLKRDAAAPPAVAESLRIICDEAFRCKRITDGLLTLARPEDDVLAPVRLDRLAVDVVSTLTALPAFASRRIIVHAVASDDWRVHANGPRLRQVLLNLTLNALEATDGGDGRVTLRLRRAGHAIVLDVEDDGCGMMPSSIGRVFEPFYTEKRRGDGDGGGTGLGLSVAHAIVSGLGGTIHAASDGAGRGSTFTLRLPAADRAEGDS